jgi:hypothetical protein
MVVFLSAQKFLILMRSNLSMYFVVAYAFWSHIHEIIAKPDVRNVFISVL